jgi:hypothetical protein
MNINTELLSACQSTERTYACGHSIISIEHRWVCPQLDAHAPQLWCGPEPTASLYFDTLRCWDCMNHTEEQQGNVCTVVDVDDWMSAELESWLLVPKMMERDEGDAYHPGDVVMHYPELLDPLTWVDFLMTEVEGSGMLDFSWTWE